jgi:GGDEF domain-containing protein
MIATHIVQDSCTACTLKNQEITQLRARVESMRWCHVLGMLNQAGGYDAIDALADGEYTIIFCDIDKMKAINTATGNHFSSNRYLTDGLRVRAGEVVFQLMGDEFVFIVKCRAQPLIRRIRRQLASQPLRIEERTALALAKGVALESAKLSATFSAQERVAKHDIRTAIMALAGATLAKKAGRDALQRRGAPVQKETRHAVHTG